MNRHRVLTPLAVLATLSLAAAPALAQQHGGGRPSSASRERATTARSAPPVRTYVAPSRAYAPRVESRGVYGSYRSFAPRTYISRGAYLAPSRFARPYYSFRPRFSLGFGLWVGYPIAYTSPYYYGYPYPYDAYAYQDEYPPAVYGDVAPTYSPSYPPANFPAASAPQYGYAESNPPSGPLVSQPAGASGSLSFEMSPSTAQVYVDGTFVGRVSDLGPTTQPLALVPGRHHVEVRASGFQTLSFDADVIAGQVIPYQGTMQPLR